MSEQEDRKFIEELGVGLQPNDTLDLVNVYKALGLDSSAKAQILEQYNDDIGAYLESQSIIPAGTGPVMNYLAQGKTYVDAFKLAGYSGESLKTVMDALSDSLYDALNAASEPEPEPDPEPEESEIVASFDASTQFKQNEYTAAPVSFTGTVYDTDPVEIIVTPTNCTLKGFATNPATEYSTAYTFTGSTLEAINAEFQGMQLCALETESVAIDVTIDGSATNYEIVYIEPDEPVEPDPEAPRVGTAIVDIAKLL